MDFLQTGQCSSAGLQRLDVQFPQQKRFQVTSDSPMQLKSAMSYARAPNVWTRVFVHDYSKKKLKENPEKQGFNNKFNYLFNSIFQFYNTI